MSTIIDLTPSVDRAPNLASRLVSVNLATITEGTIPDKAERTVSFRLVGDIHAASDRVIVGSGYTAVVRDGDVVRLPVWTAGTGEWAIEVKKSWAPHPYAIRVPAGTSTLDLSQIAPLMTLPDVMANFLITGAGVTIQQGAQWNASVQLVGGVLTFVLTVPPAGVAWWRGTLGVTTDLDTVTEPGGYGVWSSSPNAPGSGVLEVAEIRTAAGVLSQVVQTFTMSGTSPQMLTRFRGSTGWSGWTRIDGGAHLPAAAPAGLNADTVDPASGYSSLLVHGSIGATNLPHDGAGLLETWVVSPSGFRPRLQRWTVAGSDPGLWTRFSGSGGWSAWQRLDAGAVDFSKLAAPAGSASAWKTVPIALTVGGSAGTTSGWPAVRVPIRLGAQINRWRLHISNRNPRMGITGANRFIGGVWLVKATTAGNGTVITQIGGAGSIATATGDGAADEYISPWITTPLEPHTDYLISYSVDATNGVETTVGGCWTTTNQADAQTSEPRTWTRRTTTPLDLWIEADVHPSTPVVAAFGDSLSSGVGATLPVHDSWLSQLCRRIGALPVHYTASGDTMQGWSDPGHYKWSRWQHLSRPDAVIHAMGSNDVFGGADLATLQARHATTISLLRALVSPVIYGATILPRDGATGAMEDVRRSYNTWLRARPDTRQVFDMVPVISANDETISSGFNADGIHLNTAGYKAIADAIPAGAVIPAAAT